MHVFCYSSKSCLLPSSPINIGKQTAVSAGGNLPNSERMTKQRRGKLMFMIFYPKPVSGEKFLVTILYFFMHVCKPRYKIDSTKKESDFY